MTTGMPLLETNRSSAMTICSVSIPITTSKCIAREVEHVRSSTHTLKTAKGSSSAFSFCFRRAACLVGHPLAPPLVFFFLRRCSTTKIGPAMSRPATANATANEQRSAGRGAVSTQFFSTFITFWRP